MEYILLKNQLEDKKIYEKLISMLKERICSIIDKKLGLHATNYSEIKVQQSSFGDAFLSTFAELEKLDHDLQIAQEQLNLINQFLEEVDSKIATMNDKEKEIFRLKYIHGLTNVDIERRGIACEKTIRTYLKEIDKK